MVPLVWQRRGSNQIATSSCSCGAVAIGFVTARFFAVSFYSDILRIVSSATGMPNPQLFYGTMTGRSAQVTGAIFLEAMILCTGMCCPNC